jgi:hypothetical protein
VNEFALHEVGRRHQGKLVDRQRPDGSPGHDESDAPHLTGNDLLEQRADTLGIGWAAEGQGPGDGRGRAGSAGDKQNVVRNGATDRGLGKPASGVDARERPRREGRPGGRGQLGQVEVPHLAETERLGDGERPVPKFRLGRQHLDADATFPQLPQGQRGLESRDPPPAISTRVATSTSSSEQLRRR